MQQVIHIFKKEFKDYFISPIAYIVISIFLLVIGGLFFSSFFYNGQASLRGFFIWLPIIMAFFVPAITMRLFSEEINIGSYETLLTLPVTTLDVVLGKFAAASAFAAAMLLPTLSYPICIEMFGDLDWGPVIGGYVGAVLIGATYSAVGLFASAITRNQIIAFIIGMVICFAMGIIDKMLVFFPAVIVTIVEQLTAGFHFQNISKGIIDLRDIVYFLSVIFIALYSSRLTIEEKV